MPGASDMDDALGNLFSYLLGGPYFTARGEAGSPGYAAGAPGLLRRLLENYPGEPVGPSQQLAALNAVTRLTVPDGALSCLLTVEVTSVRMTVDGTVPTAGLGLLLTSGTVLALTGRPTMQGAQFLQTGAGAVVDVAYFT